MGRVLVSISRNCHIYADNIAGLIFFPRCDEIELHFTSGKVITFPEVSREFYENIVKGLADGATDEQ